MKMVMMATQKGRCVRGRGLIPSDRPHDEAGATDVVHFRMQGGHHHKNPGHESESADEHGRPWSHSLAPRLRGKQHGLRSRAASSRCESGRGGADRTILGQDSPPGSGSGACCLSASQPSCSPATLPVYHFATLPVCELSSCNIMYIVATLCG